jgi:hypothetical protein
MIRGCWTRARALLCEKTAGSVAMPRASAAVRYLVWKQQTTILTPGTGEDRPRDVGAGATNATGARQRFTGRRIGYACLR